MAYGMGSLSINVNHDVLAAGVGVGAGALQVVATRTLDQNGTLGPAMVNGISNGELINTITGVPTLVVGLYGTIWSSSKVGQHRSLSGALLTYGLTTFIVGAVVPWLVRWITGAPASAARAGARLATTFGTKSHGAPATPSEAIAASFFS